jgi:hypothetical protein
MLFNLSANDEWGDLPRRKSFLTLLDQTISHLSLGGRQRRFTVGQSVTLALPGAPAKELTVTAPSGAKSKPRVLVQRGLSLVHLAEVAEAGAYRIEGADEATFVVNSGRIDSPLAAMDRKTLTDWWSPASVDVVGAEAFTKEFQDTSHWPLWPLLVLLAGLLLIAETIYVHWLCPRANPKAAAAVVSMLKPMQEK